MKQWTADHDLLANFFQGIAKTQRQGTELEEFASAEGAFLPRQDMPADIPDDPMAPEAIGTETFDEAPDEPSSYGWGGHRNGRIPTELLTKIGQGGHRLEAQAASAWVRMREAAKADGVDLSVSDSYRSYEAQVALRNSPKAAKVATARPGTSIHGWGRAVDVNLRKDAETLAWLRRNAGRFGWVNPAWAQKKGKSYEPWHWQFNGGEG